jgi:hypothetical protein
LIVALAWLAKRHYPGTGRWSLANVMATLCLIFLSLRGAVPDWLSIVVANALAVTASVLFLQGIRLFFGLRLYWWPKCVPAALSIALGAYFRYASDNVNIRIAISAFTLGAFGLACGFTLFKRIPPDSRFGTTLTAIVFTIAGCANLARAIYIYAFAPVPDLFAPSDANAIIFAGAGLLLIGCSFGFMLMTNERMVLDSINAPLRPPVADPFGPPVSEPEIREQVLRIVHSDVFRRSTRMAQFLTLAVDRTLLGRTADLKEYALGRDVFHRGEDFDPRLDSIVRVEAQRLRRKLDEYYELYGKTDNVVVRFRAGSYVPSFTYKQPSSQNESRSASSNG